MRKHSESTADESLTLSCAYQLCRISAGHEVSVVVIVLIVVDGRHIPAARRSIPIGTLADAAVGPVSHVATQAEREGPSFLCCQPHAARPVRGRGDPRSSTSPPCVGRALYRVFRAALRVAHSLELKVISQNNQRRLHDADSCCDRGDRSRGFKPKPKLQKPRWYIVYVHVHVHPCPCSCPCPCLCTCTCTRSYIACIIKAYEGCRKPRLSAIMCAAHWRRYSHCSLWGCKLALGRRRPVASPRECASL